MTSTQEDPHAPFQAPPPLKLTNSLFANTIDQFCLFLNLIHTILSLPVVSLSVAPITNDQLHSENIKWKDKTRNEVMAENSKMAPVSTV